MKDDIHEIDTLEVGLGPSFPRRLWYRGNGDLELFKRSVAVGGARACTQYGEFVATDMSCALAEDGWTVVTGGAYGIDAAATRGALVGSQIGRSAPVAVLAGGLDRPYPQAHESLFEHIVDSGGLLISAYEPGTVPARHRFLERNKLIAQLTRGVVIIEAAKRSGSMALAAATEELGKPLTAVPGPITSLVSAGTNELIRDGRARVALSSHDVIFHIRSLEGVLA